MRSLLLLIPVLTSFSSQAKLISVAVGQVREHVLTSREVMLYNVVEKTLFVAKGKGLELPDVDSQSFAKEVTGALMEWVVYLEAQAINTSAPTGKEVSEAMDKVKGKLKAHADLSALKPSEKELRLAVERKLQSKKFIQFKADTSVIPVTDAEAEKYFEANRQRFGSAPFANFRDNVKAFLTRQQVDRRLKDWFEVLQDKYQVRNFLSEI